MILRLLWATASLFVGVALIHLANGILMTGISLQLHKNATSTLSTALVLGAYNAGLVGGTLYNDRLIQRVGHIRSFSGLAAMVCCSTLLLSVWQHPVFWLLLRLLAGWAMVGLYMVIESWMNQRADAKNRGLVLALYISIVQIALASGQILLPVIRLENAHFFTIIAGLYCLSLVPISFTYIAPPELPGPSRLGIGRLLRLVPAGVLGCFISGLVISALFALGPLYVVGKGFASQEVAWFMGALMAGGLVLQVPVGVVSDRWGRAPVLLVVALGLAGLCLGMTWLQTTRVAALLLLAFGLGSLGCVLYPLSLSLVNDRVMPEELVEVSKAMLLVYGVGSVVGPIAGTWLMSWFGPDGLLLWVAFVVGAPLAYFGYRWKKARPLTQAERGEYLPVLLPQTQPATQLEQPPSSPSPPDAKPS